MAEGGEAGGARAEGGYGQAGEIEDAVGCLQRRDGARIEVVAEVEHHVTEVGSDDLEGGLDSLGGELAPLDARRSGEDHEPAGMLDEESLQQGVVEPLEALERVEHRIGVTEVEEGRDIGLACVEIDQDGAVGRALCEAHRQVRGEGRDTEAALGGEDRRDSSGPGRRLAAPAEAEEFLERGGQVGALDRAAQELHRSGPDRLDHEVGGDVSTGGEDGGVRKRARQRPHHRRRRAIRCLLHGELDDDQIGPPARTLLEGRGEVPELADDLHRGHCPQVPLQEGGGLGVAADQEDPERSGHLDPWLIGSVDCSARTAGSRRRPLRECRG